MSYSLFFVNLTALVAVVSGPTNLVAEKREILVKPPTASECPALNQVADLPFAHGRSFCTLDDYLAHLERYAGPIGQPWWKMIRPGLYRHMTTGTSTAGETATRADLMKRFRFKR